MRHMILWRRMLTMPLLLAVAGCSPGSSSDTGDLAAAPAGAPTAAETTAGSPADAANPPAGSETGERSAPPSGDLPADRPPLTAPQSGADDPAADSDEPRAPAAPAAPRPRPFSTDAASPPVAADGRRPDDDDPEAPALNPPANARPADDLPLNDGRAPDAVPLPPDQRSDTSTVAPEEQLEDGRTAAAKASRGSTPAPGTAPPVKPAGDPPPKAATGKTFADLPDQLRLLDKNNDRQVALAEWPREDVARFVKWDANRDGFLELAELQAAAATLTGAKPGQDAAGSPSEDGTAAEKPADATGDGRDPSKKQGAKKQDAKTQGGKAQDAKTPGAKKQDAEKPPTSNGDPTGQDATDPGQDES